MGMVKEILEFFVTFGITDIFIIYLFFRRIGNCKKNKWYELLIVAFIGSVYKIIFPPVIYQMMFFIILVIYNKFINNINFKNSIKLTLYVFCFVLISEMFYSFIISLIFKIDLSTINNCIILYIYTIPDKVLNLFIILKGDKLWDYFGLEA